ncbi:ribosomal protein S12 methylthiotransferase RimO [Candidatus Epulonipiscium fishelsonii]|uniref:Ribosomal protein S12 methylthiotransferase RimO n=1 Tax=Candidatus Epulonipiscium fishelsonii TaxID=77094 RepID=A0ACC8XE27_9FIRM|nr:ribosomal protein S12 methylthiotransferase RimO [Epulopiscium sp. SCG-B05WGA-EpuloA1]ONI41228.1 ribosomal protein S12 methylthiotransferase RimO [Epulopiscium sp. SCG-B11WGA-EpuloA1]
MRGNEVLYKVAFVSLGCDKNLVDSENMLGLLAQEGFCLSSEEHKADVLVVNTCCFIEDAKKESIEQILEVARFKQEGECKALIVTGCMAQRYKDEILTEMPEVDAVVGTTSYDKIASIANKILSEKGVKVSDFEHIDKYHIENLPRVLTTAGYFAYIKIAEGCDNKCTYCIIPQLRGRFRSRKQSQILEEISNLASNGVTEVILIAQDTTKYGYDLNSSHNLVTLIREISKTEQIEWIRIMYCYPENITDELIDEMASNDKVCKYLDMPIQHSSNNILKRMARKSRNDELRATISKLRNVMPDIALRTSLIVGFPNETEEDFNNLCAFVEDVKFDRLGVFTYSQEEGTVAAEFDNQIDEDIKFKRKEVIMNLQQDISYELMQQKVGKTMKVLIEGRIPDEGVYIGRTYQDAPDVDSQVFVHSEEELLSGDYIEAKITSANEYDLVGEFYKYSR